MPPSFQKKFLHGKYIIESCILPFGELSRRRAINTKFQECLTQKTSRAEINGELINRFQLI